MDETTVSSINKQNLISSFLEITVGETHETAAQFLQATRWNLEEAVQLFFVRNDSWKDACTSNTPSVENENENANSQWEENTSQLNDFKHVDVGHDCEEVRDPLPVVRDTLFADSVLYGISMVGDQQQNDSNSIVAFRNFDEEIKHPGVWESEPGSTSTTDKPRDNLASLYRPPYELMFHGSFEKAKSAASHDDKWLLVNLQSTKEFSSHVLNRDTWANDAVSQTISTYFIFWQVYDDTVDGMKVCTYYSLDAVPVVLVIDPITGQRVRTWFGVILPESLLEDLVPFMDGGPKDHHVTVSHKRQRGLPLTQLKNKDDTKEEQDMKRALADSLREMHKKCTVVSKNIDHPTGFKIEKEASSAVNLSYPPLLEEPSGNTPLICRVCVRLPDGRRIQRNFLKTDPVQLLWSFCNSQLENAGARQFSLTKAIPGGHKLDFEAKLTFDESDLANTMITVAWE